MKILIIESPDRIELQKEISLELIARNAEVVFICNELKRSTLLDGSFSTVIQFDLSEKLSNSQDVKCENEIRELAISSVYDRTATLNIDVSKKNIENTVDRTFKWVSKSFEELKPDLVYFESEAEPISIFFAHLAKSNDVKLYSSLPICLIPNHCLLIPSSWLDSANFFAMLPAYEKEHAGDNNFSLKNIILSESVDSYLKHLSFNFKKLSIFYAIIRLLASYLQLILAGIRVTTNDHVTWFYGKKKTYDIKCLQQKLKRAIVHPIVTLVFFVSKFKFNTKKKFILVAMQKKPEATSSVIGKDYQDLEKMRSLASAAYPDAQIIFKDHPFVAGYAPLKFYIKTLFQHKTLVFKNLPRSTEFRNLDKVYVNTSGLGLYYFYKGYDVAVLGNPSWKCIIGFDCDFQPKITESEFSTRYRDHCIADDEHLGKNIADILIDGKRVEKHAFPLAKTLDRDDYDTG